MATSVAQMSKEELIQIIETVVEQKLLELFDDLDDDTTMKQAVRDRLLRQQEIVARGERGHAFSDIVQQLDLD